MLQIERDNKISLTQGDNASIRIRLNRPIFEDDILEMTVRSKRTKEQVIHLIAQNGQFNFVPEDTKNLKAGMYEYDVQLTTFVGGIYTVIDCSPLIIKEEITK